jgi:RNA polymerase sigma factor (TIGR02999 family)
MPWQPAGLRHPLEAEATVPSPDQVTALLRAWSDGDEGAFEALLPLVYGELRRLARLYMSRERHGLTLQPTALVHEAYLRLVNVRRVRWQDRAHFLAVSARVMRRVLVDMARSRASLKRAGGVQRVSFDEGLLASSNWSASLVALDDALSTLAEKDARKSQVIELRFFGGLSFEETAEALQVSTRTVMRDWRLARAWLSRELTQEPAG